MHCGWPISTCVCVHFFRRFCCRCTNPFAILNICRRFSIPTKKVVEKYSIFHQKWFRFQTKSVYCEYTLSIYELCYFTVDQSIDVVVVFIWNITTSWLCYLNIYTSDRRLQSDEPEQSEKKESSTVNIPLWNFETIFSYHLASELFKWTFNDRNSSIFHVHAETRKHFSLQENNSDFFVTFIFFPSIWHETPEQTDFKLTIFHNWDNKFSSLSFVHFETVGTYWMITSLVCGVFDATRNEFPCNYEFRIIRITCDSFTSAHFQLHFGFCDEIINDAHLFRWFLFCFLFASKEMPKWKIVYHLQCTNWNFF